MKIAQTMAVIDGVVFRCKHVSSNGKWLFFQADGSKLDPKVMWCFTAENMRPLMPYMWYSDDKHFISEHMTKHGED